MVIIVSYTILPSSWISDVNVVAEYMYLVVGTKANAVWHANCCKIAAGCCCGCCSWLLLLLQQLAASLSRVFAESQTIHVYAELSGMHASVSPQATIPPTLIIVLTL